MARPKTNRAYSITEQIDLDMGLINTSSSVGLVINSFQEASLSVSNLFYSAALGPLMA